MAIISLILAVTLMFSPITQALTSFYNDAYIPGAKQIESVTSVYEDGEKIGTITVNFKVSKDIKEWDYKSDDAELKIKIDYTYTDYESKCVERTVFEGRDVCIDETFEEIKKTDSKEIKAAIQDGAIYLNKEAVAQSFLEDSYNKNPNIQTKVKEIIDNQFNDEYLLLITFDELEKDMLEDEEVKNIKEDWEKGNYTNIESIIKELIKEIKESISKTGIKNTFIKYEKNKLEIVFDAKSIMDATHTVVNYYYKNFNILENIIDKYAEKLYEDENIKNLVKDSIVSIPEPEMNCIDSEITNCISQTYISEKTEEEIEKEAKDNYLEAVTSLKESIKETLAELHEVFNAKEQVCEDVRLYEYETEDGKTETVKSKNCTITKQTLIDAFGDSKFTLNAEKKFNGDIVIVSNIKFAEDIDIYQENENTKELNYIEFKTNTIIKNIDKFELNINSSKKVEDYQKALEKEYNKLDPYKQIDISWYDYYQDEPNYSNINRYRTINNNDYYTPCDYDSKQFYIIDGRIYLPMRYIAESFGETVEWDGANRKAYVVRENEKIDMTGIIYDGTTYVRVRDFEKLGYAVNYEENEWGDKIATIIKN